jgi:uncharacterized repeat protein (TIGR01451 family)
MKNPYRFKRLLIAFFAVLLFATTGVHAGETTLVNVNSEGAQGNSTSYPYSTAISADGRYVAFGSYADNLVAGDTNGWPDVFVHDRVTGQTTRVSVSSAGEQGNAQILEGPPPFGSIAISADGRYVAFSSFSDNLVAGDTNGVLDAFVHDRLSGNTARVSVGSSGEQGNRELSDGVAISADGRYVVFNSSADNLVAGDTNGALDAFVHDRLSGKTTRVSVSSVGAQGSNGGYSSAISADGRYVAFSSEADNLVAGDTNGETDAFVHDRVTGQTTRVSVGSAGEQGDDSSAPTAISADGRYVAFGSDAHNLVAVGRSSGSGNDAFVHDRVTGETTLVSVSSAGVPGDYYSYPIAISADGRYVALWSAADNLVAGDANGTNDSFVHDRVTGETTLVSVDSVGTQENGSSQNPSISADGRYVAFWSDADNLVAGDTNGNDDIFVRDRLLDNTRAADLEVTVTAQPASVKTGQTASYTLTVTNNGPDSADEAAALTNIIFNGTPTGITPSQGSCSTAVISVCHLGSLAAGASATIAVEIKADADPLTQQVSVNAAPKDDAPDNNVIKISTKVTVPLTCDIDLDGNVDRNDINLITAARNQPAAPGDPRDYDADGTINVNDARSCVLKCTQLQCAIQ